MREDEEEKKGRWKRKKQRNKRQREFRLSGRGEKEELRRRTKKKREFGERKRTRGQRNKGDSLRGAPTHSSIFVAATTPIPIAGARCKIGVAVDLSDECAYAIHWAVQHYIRPSDVVILLYVSSTSVLFGAEWSSIDPPPTLIRTLRKRL